MTTAPESPTPATTADPEARADAVAGLIESAARMGVEMNEVEAERWLAAMTAQAAGGDIVVDIASGVYGHRVTMLDFEPSELERFREIGRLVGFEDRPPDVTTALALSGSAAQSKIQSFPGDADFFERVHITAPTRTEATRILADLMRHKALTTRAGSTFRLIEVKFGGYPFDVVRDGRPFKAGAPIAWTPEEIDAGVITVQRPDGGEATLVWDDVAAEPGWCKLDWVVADPLRRRVANASNMLDVTWEAPDGSITPLDGFLDPYFQEVYLEAGSIPLFTRLAREVAADAVDDYVEQLEAEVRKYLTKEPNYGKAARRMYNVFRLTGRYAEAAYVRELFDEPATVLYQVWSLTRSLEEAAAPGAVLDVETCLGQADALAVAAAGVLEGEAESRILGHLLRIRDGLARAGAEAARSADVEAARAEAMTGVNEYFRSRLEARPEVRAYMATVAAGGDTA
ncbi:MAG TPA: hypothetical protein VFK38_00230 [Candidatus Limnocylindrales bacterium]|nr:hypothetical protein [Candidatus Limnocylindrales bacterium]